MTQQPSTASFLRPAGMHRLLHLGWLEARAFTPTRASAAVAWFAATFALLPFMLRRVVYESSNGDGLVIMGRRRPLLDALLSILISVGMCAAAGLLVTAIYTWLGTSLVSIMILTLVALLGLVLLLALLLAGFVLLGGNLSRSVGPETPAGRHSFIGSLSQHPNGVPCSAILLAR